MTIAREVADALTSLIRSSGTEGRAVLIGGQAIRDWHASQTHALLGTGATPPVPRSTMDVDLHLTIEVDNRADFVQALETEWTPELSGTSTGRVFTFTWNRQSAITLDLIGTTNPQAKQGVQFLAKLGSGTQVGAVRVLEPWILQWHLVERCFGPELAQLQMRRLNRLGLTAAKAGAIGQSISELVDATRESRVPHEWTKRLDKDLQDLELLLTGPWVDPLWEPRYELNKVDIQRAWEGTTESLLILRDQPPLMAVASFQTIRRIQGILPRNLPRLAR